MIDGKIVTLHGESVINTLAATDIFIQFKRLKNFFQGFVHENGLS